MSKTKCEIEIPDKFIYTASLGGGGCKYVMLVNYQGEEERVGIKLIALPLPNRLTVLRGLYQPADDVREFYAIDKFGKIERWNNFPLRLTLTDTWKKINAPFAPTPELAEELSAVIQGKYRPTKEDMQNKVPFWRVIPSFNFSVFDGQAVQDVYSDYKYFFTEPQRATFIASIEKAKGEEKPDTYNRGYVDGKNAAIKEIVKRLTGL